MSVDKRDFLSSLLTLLVFLLLNDTGKMKLAILAFLYCGEIVKNSNGHFHKHTMIINANFVFPYLQFSSLFVSGYHADTPITIKAEPFIWPTATFINIHEHPL